MIKTVLKNYLHNLRFAFTVLGILFIGAILVITDFVAMAGDIVTALSSFGDLFGNGTDAMLTKLGEAGLSLIAHFGSAVAWQVGTILAAFIFVSLIARRALEKKTFLHTLRSILTEAVLLIAGTLVMILLIAGINRLSSAVGAVIGILFIVFYKMFYGFCLLLGCWIASGKDKIRFRTAVGFKPVLLLFVGNQIITLITLAIAFLIGLIFKNVLLSFYFTVTMLVLMLVTVSINADAYICSKTQSAV